MISKLDKNKPRKNRRYNGNPLVYFRDHQKEFEQYKNRSQLSRGDSGMYRALSRAGQLEEAIPEETTEDLSNEVATGVTEEMISTEEISSDSLSASENTLNDTSVLSFGDSITGFFSALIPSSANNRSYVLAGLVLLSLILGGVYFVLGRKKNEVDI